MNKEEIKKKVRAIIAKNGICEVEEITDEASFNEDLGLDSLDIVQIIVDMEREFDISIPDDDAEKVKNLNECVALVEKFGNPAS